MLRSLMKTRFVLKSLLFLLSLEIMEIHFYPLVIKRKPRRAEFLNYYNNTKYNVLSLADLIGEEVGQIENGNYINGHYFLSS